MPTSAIMPVSNSYILDQGKRITVPTLYENVDVISEFTGTKYATLSDPQDLFYDKNGFK